MAAKPDIATGPLAGLRVIELAGLGPCPLAGQMLADLGAEVTLIERRETGKRPHDVNNRGKRSIILDLKAKTGAETVLRLCRRADLLIEGFRPGVMERLGLGPDACLAANPRLVYGRITGWGQKGPLAHTAGHDLTYLATTGALWMMGRSGAPPTPPLNLVADYGGGTMLLLFGVMAALFEAGRSGRGQVVDAAMVDGVSAMMGIFERFRAEGQWQAEREANLLDGGAPFYRCYETADGKFIALAALEPQFFAAFLDLAGLPGALAEQQYTRAEWPKMHRLLAETFKKRSRDEWMRVFADSDACVAPVLTPNEAPAFRHHQSRAAHLELAGVTQAAPAPRFSRTPAATPLPAEPAGASGDGILRKTETPDSENR